MSGHWLDSPAEPWVPDPEAFDELHHGAPAAGRRPTCPDCGGMWDVRRVPECPSCGLHVDELHAAATFYAELRERRG